MSDRYELLERVGSGGMATVWRARDRELGREVAVKVISDALAQDESFMRRFRREAQIASSLSHPNLVAVFDYDPSPSRPFIVMELVEGETLADRIGRGAGVEIEPLAEQLLGALAHIHDAGIVHRDVKPANLLIGADGRFRLTDFGIAQTEEATAHTAAGNVVGTLRCMAPERQRGERADSRSDLYSAGVVLAEAAGSAATAPGLEGLIERLQDPDPEQRPGSAEEALASLGGAPDRGAQVDATAPTEPMTAPMPQPPSRRSRLLFGGLAAGLAVLALVAALSLLGGDGDSGGGAPSAQPDPGAAVPPTTSTVTETTTEPAPAAPEPKPESPPAQSIGEPAVDGADCEALKAQEAALKDESKQAEEAAGKDKEAKKAAEDSYKDQEKALSEQIKDCEKG